MRRRYVVVAVGDGQAGQGTGAAVGFAQQLAGVVVGQGVVPFALGDAGQAAAAVVAVRQGRRCAVGVGDGGEVRRRCCRCTSW